MLGIEVSTVLKACPVLESVLSGVKSAYSIKVFIVVFNLVAWLLS